MRNGQNNNKRMRGRNNNNNNNNRKGQNPMTRVYESNGPDIKIRGTASHVAEKYMQLARDSQSSGDPVAADNYFQHAEHYFRLIAAIQEQFRQQNPYYREGEVREAAANFDDGDDDGAEGGNYAPGESQFQPREGQFQREGQPQHQQRDGQPQHHREQRFNNRDGGGGRDHQHANRPQHASPPPGDDNVERLPAFVTGGAGPQPAFPAPANGPNGHEGGPDRFPLHRRRRRRHGQRPEAGGAGDSDAAPQPAEAPVE